MAEKNATAPTALSVPVLYIVVSGSSEKVPNAHERSDPQQQRLTMTVLVKD